MNPSEVLQGEEHDYEPCLRIARSIDASSPEIDEVIEALSRYSRANFTECDKEKVVVDVVGYTYSFSATGVEKRIMWKE